MSWIEKKKFTIHINNKSFTKNPSLVYLTQKVIIKQLFYLIKEQGRSLDMQLLLSLTWDKFMIFTFMTSNKYNFD